RATPPITLFPYTTLFRSGFKNQAQQRNVSKAEVVRLQSLQIQFFKEINEIQKEKNEYIKELKVLMALPSDVNLILTEDDFVWNRSEEHTSELQSRENLVC